MVAKQGWRTGTTERVEDGGSEQRQPEHGLGRHGLGRYL